MFEPNLSDISFNKVTKINNEFQIIRKMKLSVCQISLKKLLLDI